MFTQQFEFCTEKVTKELRVRTLVVQRKGWWRVLRKLSHNIKAE